MRYEFGGLIFRGGGGLIHGGAYFRNFTVSYIILSLSPMAESLYDLYVFLSQFRPRDVRQRVCLMSYARDQSAFCAFLVEVQTNAGYIHATNA